STTASSIKNDTSTATEQTTELSTMPTTTTLIPMRVENYTYKCNMTFENNITVDEYLGIPYGKAPVGYLRFQPPVPVDPPTKESPYNASIPAATCPQDIFKTNISALDFWNPPDNISEDCLQLNMWVPANTTGAVLVNLCGGDYSRLGASNDIFNGSVLAAFSKAIVVNLNFRLGALGFASFTGTNVTGNMGLLDQQLGLKWVNDNIENFGGNKSMITLIGEQTGASSAEAHIYAKNSSGLFSRIALTSGTLENVWATQPDYKLANASEDLVTLLNCSSSNSSLKLTCLQSKNYTEILNATAQIKKSVNLTFSFPFSITRKDGNFFDNMIGVGTSEVYRKKNVSVLMGDTANEGSFFLWHYFNKWGCNVNMSTYPMEDNCNLALFNFSDIAGNVSYVLEKGDHWKQNVISNYTQPKGLMILNKRDLNFCLIFSNDSDSTNPYVYIFNHTSVEKNTSWPESFGTIHATFIEFLFGRPLRYPEHYNTTEREAQRKLSKAIMRLYGHFARTGKPNNNNWYAYNSTKQSFVISNYTQPKGPNDFKQAGFKFLSDLLFDCGLKQFADTLAKDSNSINPYVYIFNHTSVEKNTSWPESFGTIHATFIEFLFGRPLRYPNHYNTTEKEVQRKLSKAIMRLYGHFAKTGKPNNNKWYAYNSTMQTVLNLDTYYNKTSQPKYQDISFFSNCSWLISPFDVETKINRNIRYPLSLWPYNLELPNGTCSCTCDSYPYR
uniref:Acetylcholinesterase n=1 Tax=Parastrongyloides trichosuri TaxID=131310 RepID=A0A0N4ZAB0_PARTI